jgi:hypothetical protein
VLQPASIPLATFRTVALPRRRARALTATLLGLVLATVAVSGLVNALAFLGDPHELDYGESIVYGRAAALLSGLPLYHPIDQRPLTVAAYTPLYYVLAAALQAVVGPGFWPGRILSLASALIAAALVGRVSMRVSGSAWIGCLGATAFLALGFSAPAPWYTFYRVDTLGVAFSVASVLVLVTGTSARHLVVAGLFAAAAILTKQSLVGAGIAGSIWLLTFERRKALVFAVSTLVPIVLCAAVAELTTGSFVADTVSANVNPLSIASLQTLGALFLVLQAPVLVLAAFFVFSAQPFRGRSARELLTLYWLITLVSVAGIAKIGADVNYWIEFAAANAVVASLGVWQIVTSVARRPWSPMGVLCLNLSLLYVGAIAIGVGAVSFKSLPRVGLQQDADFEALVERVRAEPRQVLAMPQDVLVLAGRPIVLEPFIYSLFFDARRWDAESVVQQICDGDVGLVILTKTLEQPDPKLLGYRFWPAPVWEAMQRHMVLESMLDGRYVYVPRQESPSAARYNRCR